MAVSLTKDDVLALVNNRDSDAKLIVTEKICKTYNNHQYTIDEIIIAHDIFRMLAHDIEVKIRASLSEALKLSKDIPHDIALKLAKDVEEVAIPMLEYSEVLTDDDLCEIIQSAQAEKAKAISKRRKLSTRVRDFLIGSGADEIIDEVFANDNFVASEEEYVDMIDKYALNPNVLKKMICRASIPLPIIEKMMTEVAGNIVEEVRKKYKIIPEAFEKTATHTSETSVLSVIDHTSTTAEIDYLVDHLYNSCRLTPSITLSALCMGRKRFFISALSKRSGLPKSNIELLLQDPSLKAIPTLLYKSGIPDKLGMAVTLIIRLMEDKKKQDATVSVPEFTKWLIAKLEYFADKHQIEYLSYMMAIAKQCQKG